jgi:PAS domain-containing protein
VGAGTGLSLLSFLDAPVVVGDPEGRAAYVNPAFEARFGVTTETVTGEPLANLFDGGLREAILRAVVDSCEQGATVRFHLRHEGVGYNAVASPIVADDARVGVVIVLVENSITEERLMAIQREVQEPLEDLTRALDQLFEQTGGRRAAHYRHLVEDGVQALERLRKWSVDLHRLIAGGSAALSQRGDFDPAFAIRNAAGRVADTLKASGVEFPLRVPGSLPRVAGDEGRLEGALVELLRQRLARPASLVTLGLSARPVHRDGMDFVVIALVDDHAGGSSERMAEAEPATVRRAVEELGGELRTTVDAVVGRTTVIRLPTVKPRA